MKLRLDKYLTEMGCGTRSQVKKEILKGSVSVNGEIAKKAERKVDTEKDEIIFKGEKIFYAGYEYFMLISLPELCLQRKIKKSVQS